MAEKFLFFVLQYFPKYDWFFVDFFDIQQMDVLECARYDFIFLQHYRFKLDVPQEQLTKALEFGEIVTTFCIQYLNYSLIGCGGAKSIVTAQHGCDKKFDEFLSQGYWLYRIPKIYYNSFAGNFWELPVLPTSDLYYGNEEFITNEMHILSRILKY